MCISTNNQSEYIRRRSQKDMVMRSNCASDYDSNKVPNAAICAPGVSATSVEGESRGFFRSSTARLVLAIASVALLLSSLIGMGSTNGAANLKDLSDRVMDLTRQLQNLGLGGGRSNEKEESERDLLGLQKQLEDAEIELLGKNNTSMTRKSVRELCTTSWSTKSRGIR